MPSRHPPGGWVGLLRRASGIDDLDRLNDLDKLGAIDNDLNSKLGTIDNDLSGQFGIQTELHAICKNVQTNTYCP
jgi:hypothetical protein